MLTQICEYTQVNISPLKSFDFMLSGRQLHDIKYIENKPGCKILPNVTLQKNKSPISAKISVCCHIHVIVTVIYKIKVP